MAAKESKSPSQLQDFVKGQIQEAHKRLNGLEEEASKVLKNLMARGQQSRREIEELLHKLNAREMKLLEAKLLKNPTVKQLGKRANQATTELRKQLDRVQTRVLEASGMATQSQVKEINKEINRLSKKVEALLSTKKAEKSEVRPS